MTAQIQEQQQRLTTLQWQHYMDELFNLVANALRQPNESMARALNRQPFGLHEDYGFAAVFLVATDEQKQAALDKVKNESQERTL
jgi:hypothetical protein